MGKIQKIEPNCQPTIRSSKSKLSKNQSFGAKVPNADAIADCFEKASDSLILKGVKKLSKNTADYSEIQSQIINAIFTTTLAPLMIKYNPFSKKSDKDKTYSAVRQPISAAIAIAGGVGLTQPINNYLDAVASEGNIASQDKRISPARAYLKKDFKKEFNAAEDKKAFLEKLEPKDIDKNITKFNGDKPTGKYVKACLDTYVGKVGKERENLYKALFYENPNNIKIDKDGIIRVGKTKLNTKAIPNLTTQEELTTFLNKKNFNNVKFKDFMKDNFSISQFKDGSVKTYGLDTKLKNTKAVDFLNSLGIKGFTEDNLRQALSELQTEKLKGGVANSVRVGADKAKDLLGSTGKQASRVAQLTLGENPTKAITLEQMFQRLGYVEDAGEKATAKLVKLMDKDVSSVISELTSSKNLGNMKVQIEGQGKAAGKKITTVLSNLKPDDLAKNMIKTLKGNTDKAYSAFKSYIGIGTNLVIVTITCTVLNWVYPRFIEKFMPDLLKKDPTEPQKGGNK